MHMHKSEIATAEGITLSESNMETDGSLVGPAAFKAVVRRAERLGCVRFAHVSAIEFEKGCPIVGGPSALWSTLWGVDAS